VVIIIAMKKVAIHSRFDPRFDRRLMNSRRDMDGEYDTVDTHGHLGEINTFHDNILSDVDGIGNTLYEEYTNL
jgi:hypothetical protein